MKILHLFLFIFPANIILAQEYHLPVGAVYRNAKDFENDKAMEVAHFKFTPFLERKNFYTVTSEDQDAAALSAVMETWGIFQSDTLYINASRIGMKNGYVKVLELGKKYLYFIGRPIKSSDQQFVPM